MKQKINILFLVWGYSIHAERRMKIFIEDPNYNVTIVSTYPYEYKNCDLVPLLKGLIYKMPFIKSIKDSLSPNLKRKTRVKKNKFKIFLKKIISLRRSNIILLFLRLPFDFIVSIIDLIILKRTIYKTKPNIIFMQTLLYPTYLSYFVGKNIPKIVTFWNGDLIWWAYKNGIEKFFKKSIITNGLKTVKLITVNSQEAYNACLKYGAEKRKIHLIRYPGINKELFKPINKKEARNKLGLLSFSKIILSPRGIGGYRNDDTIVKSAIDVVKKYPDVLFLMIGADTEKGPIIYENFINENNLNDNFMWLGNIPWENINLYYACSDVVISISSNDSQPNCMLEAMACGIPLIMSNIPQIIEWVNDGINGYLINPRDENELACRIINILEDNSISDKFRHQNLLLVEKHANHNKNISYLKFLINTYSN